jgi:hypothetical protein
MGLTGQRSTPVSTSNPPFKAITQSISEIKFNIIFYSGHAPRYGRVSPQTMLSSLSAQQGISAV